MEWNLKITKNFKILTMMTPPLINFVVYFTVVLFSLHQWFLLDKADDRNIQTKKKEKKTPNTSMVDDVLTSIPLQRRCVKT